MIAASSGRVQASAAQQDLNGRCAIKDTHEHAWLANQVLARQRPLWARKGRRGAVCIALLSVT